MFNSNSNNTARINDPLNRLYPTVRLSQVGVNCMNPAYSQVPSNVCWVEEWPYLSFTAHFPELWIGCVLESSGNLGSTSFGSRDAEVANRGPSKSEIGLDPKLNC